MASGQPPPLDLAGLRAVSVLGRGAKGVVFLVRSDSGDTLALKAISRCSVERKSMSDGSDVAYRRIWFERDVLLSLRHPLLPSLRGVVSTDRIVGFAIDWCSGGDLSALRRRQTEKMFSDDVIRFYAAELVLALEHLHKLGICYRDLKPDNILIQETGHIMLVDFDLSTKLPDRSREPPAHSVKPADPATPAAANNMKKKKRRKHFLGCFSSNADVSPETTTTTDPPASDDPPSPPSAEGKSNSFVGTEEYVAPEIILGTGHDYAVDWWSLGVVLYEMLYGRTPFRGQDRKETFYRILSRQPELVGEPTPLRDLIGRLLEKRPEERISGEGIKGHEFFKGVDWESVVEVSRPPYILGFIPAGEAEESIDVEKFVEDVFGNADVAKGELSGGNLAGEGGLGNNDNISNTPEFCVF